MRNPSHGDAAGIETAIDFDLRQLRLLVTAVSAQKLFWIQQEALAHAANDAELGNIAARFVRDHQRILDHLAARLGSVVPVDALAVAVTPHKAND